MSLVDELRGSLDGASPFASGDWSCQVGDASRNLVCALTALDTLACGLSHLTLQTTDLAGADNNRVHRIAKWLAERVHYLLEPISPIEFDQDRCAVQMRSRPPRQADGYREYYELHVEAGGQIMLKRFGKQRGARRAPVPALLTREVLFRLVGDFEAAVDQVR